MITIVQQKHDEGDRQLKSVEGQEQTNRLVTCRGPMSGDLALTSANNGCQPATTANE